MPVPVIILVTDAEHASRPIRQPANERAISILASPEAVLITSGTTRVARKLFVARYY